jgi:circadian clock protein KaiC
MPRLTARNRKSESSNHKKSEGRSLPKAPTGIQGLDEVTNGGFPRGRPTLICGSAGAGKSLLAMEFIVAGATEYGEPGVFIAFEETAAELTQNVRSLGFDLDRLAEEKKLIVDFVRIERSEIDETGDYDLEGLFIRIGAAIDAIGAKRVALDTIENLFAGLQNQGITAERGEGALTRHGLEEYVSDCVILLDHRVTDQVSTRRLRVVKYRGTAHGTNEYPFLIDEGGFSVLPITSLGLLHQVSDERVSSGVPRLDTMLGGEGYHRGSTILVSGTAGTGKTSLAAHMVDAACRRGERCVYFSFEESPQQLIRNMRSIGLNLEQWTKKGLLQFHSSRATIYGLEMHLATMHKVVREYEPSVVVLDPVGSLIQAGSQRDAHIMMVRLIDFLKHGGVTAFLTNLTNANESLERTDIEISSIVDTWLFVRDIELNGERNRALYVLKSRGTAHSNQLREFLLTDHGVDLLEVYVGPEGVLTGSSRLSQEAREKAAALARKQELERIDRDRTRKREALEVRITALRKEFEFEEQDAETMSAEVEKREELVAEDRKAMARSRKADTGDGFAVSKRNKK